MRLPRWGQGTLTALNSSWSHPTPTPRSTRPLDSQSSVETSLAVYTGLRCGSSTMAVPSRTFVVWAARKERVDRGSNRPVPGGAGMRPSSA